MVYSGKEEFLTKTGVENMQPIKNSKKMDTLWVQKSRILDQIEDHVAEGGVFDLRLPLNDQVGVNTWCRNVRKFWTAGRDPPSLPTNVNMCKFLTEFLIRASCNASSIP